MNTTTLQVPLSKDLKINAAQAAKSYGFSSLQEIVRVFLSKLAKKELTIQITETPITLSKKNNTKYQKMDKDFYEGQNIYKAQDVNSLMKKLSA